VAHPPEKVYPCRVPWAGDRGCPTLLRFGQKGGLGRAVSTCQRGFRGSCLHSANFEFGRLGFVDQDRSRFSVGVVAIAAPLPLCRFGHKAALHGVAMHVA